MKCAEIYDALLEQIPLSLAEDWDNPGFLVGRKDKQIKKILIALDAITPVIDYAVNNGFDLLITHHPLIMFDSLKSVTDEGIVSSRVVRLLQHDIGLISLHTNYDIQKGCMADLAARRLHLKSCRPLGEDGIGICGTLPVPMTVSEIADGVKEAFSLDSVVICGEMLHSEKQKKLAIVPGSGADYYNNAAKHGCNVLLTGDVSHHKGLDANEAGITVIDAGHYGIEKIFLEDLKHRLRSICPKNVSIETMYYDNRTFR